MVGGEFFYQEAHMPDRTRNWDKTPEAQEYRNKYTREHYDQITICAPKGFKEILRETAQAEGLNPSQLVVKLVNKHRGTE